MKTRIAMALCTMLLLIGMHAYAEERYVWAEQGGVAFFEENGKVGLQTTDGKILHEAKFFDGGYFDQSGQANIYDGINIIGRIDKQGKIVIRPFHCTHLFLDESQEVLVFSLYGKTGFMTLDGRIITEAIWDFWSGFENGYAFVMKEGKWNRIDLEGNFTSEEWWDDVNTRTEKYFTTAISETEKRYFYRDGSPFAQFSSEDGETYHLDTVWINGEQVNCEGWSDVSILEDGFYSFKKDGHWSVIDAQTRIVLEPGYGYIQNDDTPDGLWEVWSANKPWMCGWMDSAGNMVLEMQYASIDQLTEHRWLLEGRDGAESAIANETGQIIAILPGRDSLYHAANEYVEYHRGRGTKEFRWGFIDAEGNVLSEMDGNKFWLNGDTIFAEGFVIVKRYSDDREGFVDVYGNAVFSEKWTAKGDSQGAKFSHGLLSVVANDKTGFVNIKGEFAHEPRWANATALDYSWTGEQWIAMVGVENAKGRIKYGYINDQGEPICMIK